MEVAMLKTCFYTMLADTANAKKYKQQQPTIRA